MKTLTWHVASAEGILQDCNVACIYHNTLVGQFPILGAHNKVGYF